MRNKIRSIVQDADTAELLCPKNFPIGSKRICVDTGYYETFNRKNVQLVDVAKDPIKRVTANGLQTDAGSFDFDILVLATGFDAMTGALLNMDIRGKEGMTLAQAWQAGPRSYLGLGVHGFPNFFTVTGPGSPSVLSNMLVSIEQHVDWMAGCLQHMLGSGFRRIEADAGGATAMDSTCQRSGKCNAVSSRRFVVFGRKRGGQAAGIYALCGGRWSVSRDLRRCCQG